MQDAAVKTVDRVAAILRALSARGSAGLPLTELADSAGLSRPTAHRLLGALSEVGFAFQDLATRRYRLGAGAAEIGRHAWQQHVAALVQPALERLAALTGDTVFASVQEGGAAVCVARAVGEYPIRTLTLNVGDRRPLGVGAGSLALFAALPEAEVARILARNADWLAAFPGFGAEALPALVARTRAEGHAWNEGRIVAAMNAVGVALPAGLGRSPVALSLAAIRDRMGPERRPELVRALRAEAERLRDIMGETGLRQEDAA